MITKRQAKLLRKVIENFVLSRATLNEYKEDILEVKKTLKLKTSRSPYVSYVEIYHALKDYV